LTNWIPGQARNDDVVEVSSGVDSPTPGESRESRVSASLQSITYGTEKKVVVCAAQDDGAISSETRCFLL
jgi:hypothetical protein